MRAAGIPTVADTALRDGDENFDSTDGDPVTISGYRFIADSSCPQSYEYRKYTYYDTIKAVYSLFSESLLTLELVQRSFSIKVVMNH